LRPSSAGAFRTPGSVYRAARSKRVPARAVRYLASTESVRGSAVDRSLLDASTWMIPVPRERKIVAASLADFLPQLKEVRRAWRGA